MIAFALGALVGATIGMFGMAALNLASNQDDADEALISARTPAEPPQGEPAP